MKRKPQRENCLTYISLFSSAGVGCYGFKEQGFECIASVELLPERMAVQKANDKCRMESGYIVGDILKQDTKQKIFNEIELWRDFNGVEQVDVLFATPPCQGISTLNYKKSDEEQKRNSLVVEAVKLISEIKPKIFIIENVRGFMKTICTDASGKDMTIEESIDSNLSGEYYIYHKVMNFKDYGVPCSRPRTIVVGTRKSLYNISPLNIFPSRKREITLRQAIGELKPLKYSEIDKDDLFHFARKYPQYQEEWIAGLKEGESAFNPNNVVVPYRIGADGERQELKCGHIGNKYRRLFWDRPGACISTRNDQLASQDTIHPADNRVLSIRELMILMTIPRSFKWTKDDDKLNADNIEQYLKCNELNIRRCIGEAVPTKIISTIAKNCAMMLEFQSFVENFDAKEIGSYLKRGRIRNNFYSYTFVKEQIINNAKDTGSFYTPQCVVFDAVKTLRTENKSVRILEPSVGLGAFIPQTSSLFSDCDNIEIDAIDINADVLEDLQRSLSSLDLGCNVHINFIRQDFLDFSPTHRYDFVVANPPYTKSKRRSFFDIDTKYHKTRNLFALFMVKFISYADEIACVIPKNFAIADEFHSVRRLYEGLSVVRICDFGVKYFKKVFIEIMSVHFSHTDCPNTVIEDYINNVVYVHPQRYIFHDRLWLLYRDKDFDDYIKTLKLNAFSFFRDRQITNSKTKPKGKIWVLRSKNILDSGEIVSKEGYDKFIDDVNDYSIGRFLNSHAIIMPNFTYNTRAAILPDGAVPNGSIAVLMPSGEMRDIDLSLYSTEEFRRYYSIVKSKSKFTLNIDNCSIYYIGVRDYAE